MHNNIKNILLNHIKSDTRYFVKAINSLDHHVANQQEATHIARVILKKMHALLNLVKPKLSTKTYQHLHIRLSNAKDKLGQLRDNTVAVQTLQYLLAHATKKKQIRAFRTTLQTITLHLPTFSKTQLRQTLQVLQTTMQAFKKIHFWSWCELAPGFKNTYQHLKKCMRIVAKTSDDKDFHSLRKSCKKLLFQLKFIKSQWPKNFAYKIKKLDALQLQLGCAQDMLITQQLINQKPNIFKNISDKTLTIKLLQKHKQKLHKKCLKKTNKIFAASGLIKMKKIIYRLL